MFISKFQQTKIISIEPEENGQFKFNKNTLFNGEVEYFPITLFKHFSRRIYRFYAERLNIAAWTSKGNSKLRPDAANLAEVLGVWKLQGKKKTFERFNLRLALCLIERVDRNEISRILRGEARIQSNFCPDACMKIIYFIQRQ